MAAGPAVPGVVATPSQIVFNDPGAVAEILLASDGGPIPADRVVATKVYIGAHDYDHMFDIRTDGGKLLVSPNSATEIGSYRLVISTKEGEATVAVYTPLADLETSLERQAAAAGLTVNELKHALGLFTVSEREYVTLNLPPVYYEGQQLAVAMEPPATRDHKWYVNERLVESGQGPHSFTYTVNESGILSVRYEEWNNGKLVTTAFDTTQVVAEPPILWAVRANQEFSLAAPEGYTKYTWYVNGEQLSRERIFTHRFTTPATYRVEVHAMGAVPGDTQAHRKIAYEVHVKNLDS